MSASAPIFEVKGWCPGALRPMESGDGLIVRVRPRVATLSPVEMQGIATVAERYGNGHIDLTRRANLQIRGVGAQTLSPLQSELRGLGLLDESAAAEAIRNILMSPLAGLDPTEHLDMRPLALELAQRLAGEPAALTLPSKFGVVLDGGGQLPLEDERADFRLVACPAKGKSMIAIARGNTEWLGMVDPDRAAAVLCAIIAGNQPKLQFVETLNVQRAYILATLPCTLHLSAQCFVVGIGAPFGRLEVNQLRILAEIASEIRLSPWRMLYIPVADSAAARHVTAAVRAAGFATEPDDPRMRVQACSGRPACRSAHADTRADAEMIARLMADTGFSGTVHISGCAKGCASAAPAALTLVGAPAGYRVMQNAAAREAGGVIVAPPNMPKRLAALMGGPRHG